MLTTIFSLKLSFPSSYKAIKSEEKRNTLSLKMLGSVGKIKKKTVLKELGYSYFN